MRAIGALSIDREVEDEFFEQRRSLEIGRVDRLGAAVGLNTGAKEIHGRPLQSAQCRRAGHRRRHGLRAVPSKLAVTGMLYGFGERRVSSGKLLLCRISGQVISRVGRSCAELERCHQLGRHQLVHKIGRRTGALALFPRSCITRQPFSASS